VVDRIFFNGFGEPRQYHWGGPKVDVYDELNGYFYGFTGHEHDEDYDARLINAGGREYDPILARFLSPDPFIQAPQNMQSMNRYSYTWNNPLNATDPSGYNTCGSDPYCAEIHGRAPNPWDEQFISGPVRERWGMAGPGSRKFTNLGPVGRILINGGLNITRERYWGSPLENGGGFTRSIEKDREQHRLITGINAFNAYHRALAQHPRPAGVLDRLLSLVGMSDDMIVGLRASAAYSHEINRDLEMGVAGASSPLGVRYLTSAEQVVVTTGGRVTVVNAGAGGNLEMMQLIARNHADNVIIHVEHDAFMLGTLERNVVRTTAQAGSQYIYPSSLQHLAQEAGTGDAVYLLHPDSLSMVRPAAQLVRPGGEILATIDSAMPRGLTPANTLLEMERAGLRTVEVGRSARAVDATLPGYSDTFWGRQWFDYFVRAVSGL
jgi:RHS repeat-associated protein